jgi:hypothetical protein
MWLLTVLVLAAHKPTITAHIPYPTRFTCEAASDHPALPRAFAGLAKGKHVKVRVLKCKEINHLA